MIKPKLKPKFLKSILVIGCACLNVSTSLIAQETLSLENVYEFLNQHPKIGNCQQKAQLKTVHGETQLIVETYQETPEQYLKVTFNRAVDVSRGPEGYFYYADRPFQVRTWGGLKKTSYRDVMVLEFSPNHDLIGFKTRLFERKVDPRTNEPYWLGIKNLFCLGNPY